MKKIVIIGNESFARLMYIYLQEYSDYEIVAFSADRRFLTGETFMELPQVALEDLEEHYPPETYDVMVCVGYSKMNQVREALFKACKEKGYHIASFIHPTVMVSASAELGEGNIVLESSSIAPLAKLGDGNLLWDNVAISHSDVIGSFNTFSGAVGVSGEVNIGNNCFLGKHAMVFDHVTIADFTLVGAGAFCKRDTKPYDVIVPARSVTLEGRKSTDYL